MEPPIKFKKGELDRVSTFRAGLLGKEVTFFSEGGGGGEGPVQFSHFKLKI